jgi:hypothetical protein
MGRNVTIYLLLCMAGFAELGPRWLARAGTQQVPGSGRVRPAETLDAKAIRAQAGDEASVRELGRAIVGKFGWASRPAIQGRILERVVKAEALSAPRSAACQFKQFAWRGISLANGFS